MSEGERTLEQLRQHYEVERELATRLRDASREERQHLYASLYDELFRRVPHHSQMTQKVSAQATQQMTAKRMRFLRRFLHRDSTFLEIGAGDCAVSIAVSTHVRQVYAIDVSEEVMRIEDCPQNVKLILSDGIDIPLSPNSADIAYSDQLMEHLHPDDAYLQLTNIYRVLSPGGTYICVTPNRISGPHDVSRHFDMVATGFHLKEYTITELSDLLLQVGFSHVHTYIGGGGYYVRIPTSLMKAGERLLSITLPRLPKALRRSRPVAVLLHVLLNIRLVATKTSRFS